VVTGVNVASLGDHSSTSLIVRFSPSGAFLAAAFEGGTIAAWDPKVGREHLKHEGCHTEPIMCLEFSKDSALLASCSRDHAIQVWSVETAQAIYRLTAHEGPVTSLVFSSDSLRLVSGSEDNLIIIWDMSTGKLVRGMMGHRKAVNCVAISKDGSIIASGSEDKTIKIWDTNSGKCLQTFSKGHHTGIRSVHFFDEDRHVIAACDEAVISWNVVSRSTSDIIWSAEQFFKKTMKRFPAWQVNMIGWGAPKPLLRFIMEKTFAESNSWRLTTAYATQSPSFAFANLGFLFTGSLPSPINGVPLNSIDAITAVAVSSNGNWAATTDPLGSLQIFDLTMPRHTWEDLETAAKSSPLHTATRLVPSPNGTRFITENLMQWSLADADYHVIKKIDIGVLGSIRDEDDIRFKFSADGSIFFCVLLRLFDDDKSTVRVFDSVTGEQRTRFKGLKKVHSFVASADGAWIACGHGSGQVDVFSVASGERMSLKGSDDSLINVLLFSDDGRELVGGSKTGVVRVWDRANGTCKATFGASTSMVTALAHAGKPGGARIAIGREDGSLSLWSPSTSASHDILRGDQATVKNVDFVQFSPDDWCRLTSRGGDGTVFNWAIPFAVDDADMARCTLCPCEEGADGVSNPTTLPHLLSQSDPDEAVDSHFHTAYRVRKDGWLVKGDRRVIWFPAFIRPRGKDAFYAYENGQVVFCTSSTALVFLKWVDG
jgi:WD40 repeat protein